MASPVVDHRPSPRVLRIINPILRALLLSPAARVLPDALGVLEYAGRRTGKRHRIVVGSHDLDGGKAVFTSAPWSRNFRGGAPATLIQGGRRRPATGTLVDDPEVVARGFRTVLDEGAPSRALGLEVPDRHRMTAEDVRAVQRVMVRIDPA
jgi:hypothetical protein